MTGEDIKKLVLKRVDLKGLLVEDLLKTVLHEALASLVAKSDNTIDDAMVAFLEPIVIAEAEKQLDKLLAELAK
jgi:hypothetical protein